MVTRTFISAYLHYVRMQKISKIVWIGLEIWHRIMLKMYVV